MNDINGYLSIFLNVKLIITTQHITIAGKNKCRRFWKSQVQLQES